MAKSIARDIVAQHNHDVGFQGIRGVDDALHLRQPHIRTAGMQIGNDRNGELAAGGPTGWRRARTA